MAVTDGAIANSLLISTRDGAFPESEEVLTTDLGSSSLGVSLHLFQEARHRVETELRTLGQQSSSDIDKWIGQVRQLQEEVERSKTTARQITKDFEYLTTLADNAEDARAKLQLLQDENIFNQTISSSLEDVRSLDRDLDEAESDLALGRVTELAARIDWLSSRAAESAYGNAAEINRGRCSRLRVAVVEGLTVGANSLVDFHSSPGHRSVKVDHGMQGSPSGSLDSVLQSLADLGALEDVESAFTRTFRTKICEPALSPSSDAVCCSVDESLHCLTLSSKNSPKHAQGVIDCLLSIFKFLRSQFPGNFGCAVGAGLSEDLVLSLISNWLTPSIPTALPDLLDFNDKQASITQLTGLLASYGWPGHGSLAHWVDSIIQIWLDRRCATSLDAVRKALKVQRGPGKEVQRVERRLMFDVEETSVPDEADRNTTGAMAESTAASAAVANGQEEDLSAWDLDDDNEHSESEAPNMSNNGVSHEAELDEACISRHTSPSRQEKDLAINGSSQQDEVTLTESYQVTDIPDLLLGQISQDLKDISLMKNSSATSFGSGLVFNGLVPLPSKVPAMFRAIAPACYNSTMMDGNMHLYNDCIYLIESLRSLATRPDPTQLSRDCSMLENFARSAYAREMDIQRTILEDLMDGAQGFVRCTSPPYSEECEKAVSSTIDRLRTVYSGWSSILSRSVLLQSIGSLLSTVVNKISKDIEEIEDISDAESQRLTDFCGRLSLLEDLFLPDQPQGRAQELGTEAVPLTAVYVPGWLRFQYLSNILESSLVDIRYLWTEGELGLEFKAEEVIDLMEALFAESQHRRNAIADIRRHRVVREENHSE